MHEQTLNFDYCLAGSTADPTEGNKDGYLTYKTISLLTGNSEGATPSLIRVLFVYLRYFLVFPLIEECVERLAWLSFTQLKTDFPKVWPIVSLGVFFNGILYCMPD